MFIFVLVVALFVNNIHLYLIINRLSEAEAVVVMVILFFEDNNHSLHLKRVINRYFKLIIVMIILICLDIKHSIHLDLIVIESL